MTERRCGARHVKGYLRPVTLLYSAEAGKRYRCLRHASRDPADPFSAACLLGPASVSSARSAPGVEAGRCLMAAGRVFHDKAVIS